MVQVSVSTDNEGKVQIITIITRVLITMCLEKVGQEPRNISINNSAGNI